LTKPVASQNTLALKDAESFRPTLQPPFPPKLTSAQINQLVLQIGFETFFPEIRKLSDILVVFGSNDINPTCTSFSVSHTAAVCFVTPLTDLFGQRKAKPFAVSFHNTLPSLNKFSALPLNILAILSYEQRYKYDRRQTTNYPSRSTQRPSIKPTTVCRYSATVQSSHCYTSLHFCCS
jgi:hypothetical protein